MSKSLLLPAYVYQEVLFKTNHKIYFKKTKTKTKPACKPSFKVFFINLKTGQVTTILEVMQFQQQW